MVLGLFRVEGKISFQIRHFEKVSELLEEIRNALPK